MPEEKCIIHKKKPVYAQGTSQCVIRVGAETYQAITEICEATGQSIRHVTEKLLDFAIRNLEIQE